MPTLNELNFGATPKTAASSGVVWVLAGCFLLVFFFFTFLSLVGVGGYVAYRHLTVPSGVDDKIDVDFDPRPYMKGEDRVKDAAIFSAVFENSSHYLSGDTDLVTNWKQHDAYFDGLGVVIYKGEDISGKYPKLAPKLKTYLQTKLPKSEKFDKSTVSELHASLAESFKLVK